MSSSEKVKGYPFARGEGREVRAVDFRTFRPGRSDEENPSAEQQEALGQEGNPVQRLGDAEQEESERRAEEELWENRVEEARREGYARACTEYEAKLAAVNEELLGHQERLLEGLLEVEEQALKRVLHVAQELGRKYASHLIHRELQVEENLVAAVRGPLQRAYGMDNLRLFVHPEAVGPLNERLVELVRGELERKTIEIVADGSLKYGDCRISAEEGQIESLLEERLDRLVKLTESRLESLSYSQPPLVAKES